MTAEIVVMNRLGVALASDSAASVLIDGRTKLFHSDKLYMLSRCQPVGVMVYNNSALAHVPWETLIKLFRERLGNKSFSSLDLYGGALIEFLQENVAMFPETAQREVFLQGLIAYFRVLQGRIRNESKGILRPQVGDVGPKLNGAAQKVLTDVLIEWNRADDWVTDKAFGVTAIGRLSREVSEAINECFPYLNADNVRRLMDVARAVVTKLKMLPEAYSGIVIAGFGADEHFPSLVSYEIGGFFESKLKVLPGETVKVDGRVQAAVVPFAQTDAVYSFLYGARPSLYEDTITEVAQVILGLPDLIIDGMPGVGKQRKSDYKSKVQAGLKDVASEMFRELQERREAKFLRPVLDSIAHLPKGELAHVASTLVNLSSFQKRVSMTEDETVGGPIDVALITKGDGFIWVERKHYFKAELNSHYFRNRDAPPTSIDKENEHAQPKARHQPFRPSNRRSKSSRH